MKRIALLLALPLGLMAASCGSSSDDSGQSADGTKPYVEQYKLKEDGTLAEH